MRYDLTSLDLFITVAQERNLTRAAGIKHLAVSAVSKRISELEAQIGSPLLIRNTRGVELTPAGQSLLHYARQLKQTMAQLDNELSEFAAGVKGHIRVHAITSALSQFLPQDMASFARLYPQIRFDIEERIGSAVIRAVADDHADLGIISSHTPPQGLETLPYRRDELVVVTPPGHELANRRSVPFSEVLQHELVGPHQDSTLHRLLTEQAQALGQTLKLRIRISSFDCMCRMVVNGLGLTVLPRSVVEPYVRSHRLKRVSLSEPWAHRSLLLVFKKYEIASPPLKTFIDHLRAPCEA